MRETVLRALFLQADLNSDKCELRILGVLYRSSRDLVMGRVQRTRTVTRAQLADGYDVVDALVTLLTLGLTSDQ